MARKAASVVLVEDDAAHAELVRRSFLKLCPADCLTHLKDGQEALDYLFRRGKYADTPEPGYPDLIVLDLRMPKVNGIEVLNAVKAHESLRTIPVVILTTSSSEADIRQAYALHVNSFLVKPLDFGEFRTLMETLFRYWLDCNRNLNTIRLDF